MNFGGNNESKSPEIQPETSKSKPWAVGEEAEAHMLYPHLSQRSADSPDRRVQPFLHSTDEDSPHIAFMHVFDPIPLTIPIPRELATKKWQPLCFKVLTESIQLAAQSTGGEAVNLLVNQNIETERREQLFILKSDGHSVPEL